MPGQVTGTIGQEEVRLENAATESTLQLLLEAMNKLAKDQGGSNSAKGQQAVNKAQDLYKKTLTDTEVQQKKNIKQLKETEKEQKKYNDTLKQTVEFLGKLGAGLDTWTRRLGKGLEMAFNTATPSIEGFASAFEGIPVVGGLISSFGKVLGQQVTTFRDLAGAGIDLGNSLFSAQEAAARAGLPLDTFGKVLAENSGNLALFGGSAGEGARRFADISKNIRKSGFDRQLANLGFSMEDVASHTASYLAQQTMLGRAQGKTNEELAEGAQTYLLELDKLARVHGMSRKELEKQLEANKADLRMKALMMSMNPKVADALDKTLATIKDTEMKEALTEMVATGGIPMKSELAKGMAIFSPALKQAAADLKNGSISQERFNEIMRSESARFEQEMKTNGASIARMKAAGVDIYDFQIKMAGTYKNFGREVAAETEAQKKARESSEKSAAGIDRTLTDLRNAFAKAFIDTGLLDKMATGLSFLVEVIGKVANTITTFIADLSTMSPIDAVKNLVTNIGGLFGTLFDNPKVYGYLAGGIAALFAAAVVKKALVGSLSNLTSSIANKMTLGGGKGSSPLPTSKGAGGALGGIGKGTGDALGGLARGIMAFANPMVMLGAVGLGAAITAVGAGLAGATWIMSKALPSLAEGMKAFEALDGAKLKDAGLGIMALGGGLAAFGAGGALGGLGSVMGAVGDAVTEFFGGQTPFQKLEEFSKLDIDGPRVKVNAEAFAAFAQGMALMGGGGILGGLGAIAEGIGQFFGGKPPFEKFVEFSKLDINQSKVKSNSEAFAAFAEAFAKSNALAGGSALISGLGSLVEGIATFFGGKPPFDKFVEFSKLNVDQAKVKSNAEAFAAFSKAFAEGGALTGGSALVSGLGSLVESMATFFGGRTPIDKFVEFSKLDINADSVSKTAKAFVDFSNAMSAFPAGTDIVAGIGTIVAGAANFFNGKNPIDKFVEFARLDIDPDRVSVNAKAFVDYSVAMSKFPAGTDIASGIGIIVDGVATFFGGKNPIDKFVSFARLDIDPDKVSKNAKAFVDFGKAMAAFPAGTSISAGIGSILEGLGSFFGGKTPIEKLKEFAALDIDSDRVIKNAKAFTDFANVFKTVQATDFSLDLSKLKISGADLSQTDDIVKSLNRINAAMKQFEPGLMQKITDSVSNFIKPEGATTPTTTNFKPVTSPVPGMTSPVVRSTTMNDMGSAIQRASDRKAADLRSRLANAKADISTNDTNRNATRNTQNGSSATTAPVIAPEKSQDFNQLVNTLNEQLYQLNNTMNTLVEINNEQKNIERRTLTATRENKRGVW